ncbi:MAG TPA: aminomethyl-transferring glycine dehydrogenase subunit GcvPA [Candidatus Intestinimonas pullistercoris]|uniref:Probable glycine dehydrogenase (decarboxylating) subunit 1 n=1 Tax=Candidatus Intestinimonas pullistercoris TaxID=2838623 RepID=A0A9D2P138_9FIRM|nr:aminomethyl-transferring glycine dehydrogenase subunit GcvPA [Candidatus Intestinimonas pullistercoris]
MGSYLPSTAEERQSMLEAIGCQSMEDLYAQVPPEMRVEKLDLPEGKSELEVRRILEGLAAENTVFPAVFRGAGAYRHYIPAIVKSVTSKETFVTAYTPYQAELSQGVLQSIFEYQTMICALTGMDASNASLYDGASAAAEAVAMCRERKRSTVLLSAAAHPMVRRTVETYCFGNGMTVKTVPMKNGFTDAQALSELLDDTVACFYLQQPNYYGRIEQARELGGAVHAAGGKFIMGVNPIAMAVLKTPGECGADIAVGEGQPLGLPLSFGGPYLGFMAATAALTRKLPGRIVGETTDHQGRRAYVLTLQAREQHIRREKASSNVCSNQALCAMTAAVYLAAMGPRGLRQAAESCMAHARYAAERICAVKGFDLVYPGPYFHEFVTTCPGDPARVLEGLARRGILGGLPLEDGNLLWCATEVNTKGEIDALEQALREVV